MVPLIADQKELEFIKNYLVQHIDQLFKQYDQEPFPYEIGTMIELPRACLTADKLAEEADFFSFGTNDLTQMTYGFSRDDIGKFIGQYKELEILPFDPFQMVDKEGVGELMKIAIRKARQVKPNIPIEFVVLVEILFLFPSSRRFKLPMFPALLIAFLQLD